MMDQDEVEQKRLRKSEMEAKSVLAPKDSAPKEQAQPAPSVPAPGNLRSQGEMGKLPPSTPEQSGDALALPRVPHLRREEMVFGPDDPPAQRTRADPSPAWDFESMRSDVRAFQGPTNEFSKSDSEPEKQPVGDFPRVGRGIRMAGQPAPGTIPEGGMSPLADRQDPGAWSQSGHNVPAPPLGPARTRNDERTVTPAEPVGGWVDGATGRGKVLVPSKDASKLAIGRSSLEETQELEHSMEDAAADEVEASENDVAPDERDEEAERDAKALPRADGEDEDEE